MRSLHPSQSPSNMIPPLFFISSYNCSTSPQTGMHTLKDPKKNFQYWPNTIIFPLFLYNHPPLNSPNLWPCKGQHPYCRRCWSGGSWCCSISGVCLCKFWNDFQDILVMTCADDLFQAQWLTLNWSYKGVGCFKMAYHIICTKARWTINVLYSMYVVINKFVDFSPPPHLVHKNSFWNYTININNLLYMQYMYALDGWM